MGRFLRPKEVLDRISLEEEARVVEFGCGTGKFVLALAKTLPQGRVYGIDIQKEPLEVLRREAKRRGFYHVEAIRGDLERKGGSGLANESLDFVFIPNVLFQVEEKESLLREGERVLKKGGKLLVLDWEKESPMGPKEEWRLSRDEVKKEAEKQGLEFKREVEAGTFHFGLLFQKP